MSTVEAANGIIIKYANWNDLKTIVTALDLSYVEVEDTTGAVLLFQYGTTWYKHDFTLPSLDWTDWLATKDSLSPIPTMARPGFETLGSFDPEPAAQISGSETPFESVAGAIDSAKHLSIRGPIITDEGSFRDSFIGADLYTDLTGAVTFTNGSSRVTGVGTAFTSEVNRQDALRLTGSGLLTMPAVSAVLSDTEIELDDAYPGATGTGVAQRTFWQRSQGTGGSYTYGSSQLTLVAGTAATASQKIWRFVDYLPLIMTLRGSLSQRIANQTTSFGFESDPSVEPRYLGQSAKVVFDGVVNTTIKFVTSASAAAADTQTTTVALPTGRTSATEVDYTITMTGNVASLAINGVPVARHTFNIPGPYTNMRAFAGIENSAITGSSTSLVLQDIGLNNTDIIQISNNAKSDPVNVRTDAEAHYHAGSLATNATTADQEILSYTVPAGREFWLIGYTIASTTTGANANPFKIGRNSVTGLPGTPGVTDGNICIVQGFLNGQGRLDNFGSNPIPLAKGGDAVKVTVTPSANTATTWYATIFFELR